MAFHDTAPELIIGPHAQTVLDLSFGHDIVEIWTRLFSLLSDPGVDGAAKTDLAFFPYGPEKGVRQLMDEDYVITYRESPNGDIHVLTIHRVADLPHLR